MGKLTKAMETYVQELIKGKSQREAYRVAYPSSVKWKDNAVDVSASRLFNTPKVKLRYEQLKARLVDEAEADCIVTAKQVLQELAGIAFADIKNFVSWAPEERVIGIDPQGRPYKTTVDCISLIPSVQVDGRTVQEVSNTSNGIKIKLYNKVEALTKLGEVIGILGNRKVEVTGKDGGPVRHEVDNARFSGMSDRDLATMILQAAQDIIETDEGGDSEETEEKAGKTDGQRPDQD